MQCRRLGVLLVVIAVVLVLCWRAEAVGRYTSILAKFGPECH